MIKETKRLFPIQIATANKNTQVLSRVVGYRLAGGTPGFVNVGLRLIQVWITMTWTELFENAALIVENKIMMFEFAGLLLS